MNAIYKCSTLTFKQIHIEREIALAYNKLSNSINTERLIFEFTRRFFHRYKHLLIGTLKYKDLISKLTINLSFIFMHSSLLNF